MKSAYKEFPVLFSKGKLTIQAGYAHCKDVIVQFDNQFEIACLKVDDLIEVLTKYRDNGYNAKEKTIAIKQSELDELKAKITELEERAR
jgi:hypothetical protein